MNAVNDPGSPWPAATWPDSPRGAVPSPAVPNTAARPKIPGLTKTIVLVGLMGCGKTSIGRRLATVLQLPFRDADNEIESAAGCTVEEIFQRYGEAGFRDGERRVIARLLDEPVHVLATGGGAYIDTETRRLIRARGLSVWLHADLDLLLARTARRNNRPLLKQGDPRDILERLIKVRNPIYAEADLIVESDDSPPEETLDRVVAALHQHWSAVASQQAGVTTAEAVTAKEIPR